MSSPNGQFVAKKKKRKEKGTAANIPTAKIGVAVELGGQSSGRDQGSQTQWNGIQKNFETAVGLGRWGEMQWNSSNTLGFGSLDWAIEQLKLMEWVGSLKFWANENFRWAILYIINIGLLFPANNVGIA